MCSVFDCYLLILGINVKTEHLIYQVLLKLKCGAFSEREKL